MAGWMVDPKAEETLNLHGISWRYETLPIAKVAPDLANRARLDARVNQDVVLDYALQMIEGEDFPAVVVYDTETPPYRTASGNHRIFAALEAKLTEVDAYIIPRLNSLDRLGIELALNIKNGLRVPTTDRVRIAIEAMEQENLSPVEVARIVSVRPGAIRDRIRIDRTVDRLVSLGFTPSAINDLGGVTILKVFAQTDSDPALAALATHQSQRGTRLTRDELATVMSEVKKHRDDASKVAFINARYQAERDRKGSEQQEHKNGHKPYPAKPIEGIKPRQVRKKLLDGLARIRTILYTNRTRSQAGLLLDNDYRLALQSAKSIYEYVRDMKE